MAPSKSKDAPRGTVTTSIHDNYLTFTVRAIPLPVEITEFIEAHSSTIKSLVQQDRAFGSKLASKHEEESENLTTEIQKQLSSEEFWKKLKELWTTHCSSKDWVGFSIENIWSFGPKRVGGNLLLDRSGLSKRS
jgi:ribosome assembly protein 1